MSVTLDIIAGITVPSTYNWDEGVPGADYTSLIVNLADIKQVLTNGEEQFVGYAPYFTILLSSDPFSEEAYNQNLNHTSYITREINFGDYYNSQTNIQGGNAVSIGENNQMYASHTYVMPGTYSIKYTQTIVDVVTSTDDNSIYKQQLNEAVTRVPFSWQWYNFQKDPHHSETNLPVSWLSAGFQSPNELVWNKTQGECVSLNYLNSNIVWQWDNLIQTPDNTNLTIMLCGAPLTWEDLSSYSPKGATWDFTKAFFRGDHLDINLKTTKYTLEKNFTIKVLERAPDAYLMAIKPASRDEPLEPVTEFPSPVTVQITPRFTKCGSFPIEKIVWDMGDGSPLLVQRRWAPTLESPFYYSGAFKEDADDPRNYDVVYTYNKTPTSPFCFYPSITAFSSSTSTSDSAAVTIGPLRFVTFDPLQFKLLQTELTDGGKIIIGQVENSTAVWRADK